MRAWGTLTVLIAIKVTTASVTHAQDVPTSAPRGYVLAELNRDGIPPLLKGITTKEDWAAKRETIRRAWLDYIGGLPEPVPTNLRVVSETAEKDHVRQKIVYATAQGDEVPAYLLIPNWPRESGRRYPAVIALHPTNAQGKDSVATSQGRANRMYGMELVARGYVVLAPDALTSGERIYPGLKEFRDAPFYKRHPQWTTVAKNITDHRQGIDVLAEHPLVDAQRIGAIGHSFGAYNAYFLAGADERVRCVVASCGFSPFTNSPNPGHWGVRDWYTHLPRLTGDLKAGRVPFEFHEIVALAAPTPMFFYSAQGDKGFPHWQSIGACMADLRGLYRWMGVDERFTSLIGVGDHDFPEPVRKMSYDFLDRWLREERPPEASGATTAPR
jgi:dienelactone hydrolase